jgi:hypothetical protein
MIPSSKFDFEMKNQYSNIIPKIIKSMQHPQKDKMTKGGCVLIGDKKNYINH